MAEDARTKALLHFNTPGTVVRDETGRAWAIGDSSEIVTAQSKFGGASIYFPSDAGIHTILTNDSEDFNVGSGDFTVDCWVNRSGSSIYLCGQCSLDGADANKSFWMGVYGASQPIFGVRDTSNVDHQITYAWTLPTSEWHHLAGVRYGNNLIFFVDGVNRGTSDVTGLTVKNSAYKFGVGGLGETNGSAWYGYIDEFRFVKGVAKWTTDFTPPTNEYSMSDGGMLGILF